VDSDEEFDEAEPILNCSQLKQAGAAAHAAFSPVRERFATERASRRKEMARVLREQRTEAKRDQRREELLSSISAFSVPADADIAPSPPSSSSFLSSYPRPSAASSATRATTTKRTASMGRRRSCSSTAKAARTSRTAPSRARKPSAVARSTRTSATRRNV